jgi:hypothetical protein
MLFHYEYPDGHEITCIWEQAVIDRSSDGGITLPRSMTWKKFTSFIHNVERGGVVWRDNPAAILDVARRFSISWTAATNHTREDQMFNYLVPFYPAVAVQSL